MDNNMHSPSAPYYPPAFNVSTNITSPLQPALGNGMHKGNMMQMNMLNTINPMDGRPIDGTTHNVTQVVVGGPGMQYFSPSPHPISMTCPHCRNDIVTQVHPITGCLSHIVAGALCIFGCCCVFCIPYLVDSFKDIEHVCSRPECGRFIGVYKRV